MRALHHGGAALTALALLLLVLPAAASAAVRVTLTKAPARVAVGDSIVVAGTVGPGHRAYPVTLERRGTRTWGALQTRRTTARGAFAFSRRATAPGTASYRVIAGPVSHALAVSRTIRVVVTARPVVIAPPLAPVPIGPAIATTVLPFGTLGVDYLAKLSSGDQRIGSWSVAAGALPPGLALSPAGLLSGAPRALGASTFSVAFTDITSVRSTQQLTLTVEAPPAVTQVATGDGTVCALRVDHTVACWGTDADGEIASQAAGRSGSYATPVQIDDLDDATGISVGFSHACAVRATGAVECWGHNAHGAVGIGSPDPFVAWTPRTVPGIADAVAVSAGAEYTCALRRTGGISCWGGNAGTGDIAGGEVGQTYSAIPVAGIADATEISTGDGVACALRANRTVACWGSGVSGALGDGGTLGLSATPVAVSGLTDAVSVEAGEGFVCAVRVGGNVVCWGAGAYGALGDGAATDSGVPVTVSGLTDAAAIAVGTSACAIRRTGAVVCWGANWNGQLGNGTRENVWVPVPANGLTGVTAIGFGSQYACAVTFGRVACWGSNASGQLGIPVGTVPLLQNPTLVNGV